MDLILNKIIINFEYQINDHNKWISYNKWQFDYDNSNDRNQYMIIKEFIKNSDTITIDLKNKKDIELLNSNVIDGHYLEEPLWTFVKNPKDMVAISKANVKFLKNYRTLIKENDLLEIINFYCDKNNYNELKSLMIDLPNVYSSYGMIIKKLINHKMFNFSDIYKLCDKSDAVSFLYFIYQEKGSDYFLDIVFKNHKLIEVYLDYLIHFLKGKKINDFGSISNELEEMILETVPSKFDFFIDNITLSSSNQYKYHLYKMRSIFLSSPEEFMKIYSLSDKNNFNSLYESLKILEQDLFSLSNTEFFNLWKLSIENDSMKVQNFELLI